MDHRLEKLSTTPELAPWRLVKSCPMQSRGFGFRVRNHFEFIASSDDYRHLNQKAIRVVLLDSAGETPAGLPTECRRYLGGAIMQIRELGRSGLKVSALGLG